MVVLMNLLFVKLGNLLPLPQNVLVQVMLFIKILLSMAFVFVLMVLNTQLVVVKSLLVKMTKNLLLTNHAIVLVVLNPTTKASVAVLKVNHILKMGASKVISVNLVRKTTMIILVLVKAPLLILHLEILIVLLFLPGKTIPVNVQTLLLHIL